LAGGCVLACCSRQAHQRAPNVKYKYSSSPAGRAHQGRWLPGAWRPTWMVATRICVGCSGRAVGLNGRAPSCPGCTSCGAVRRGWREERAERWQQAAIRLGRARRTKRHRGAAGRPHWTERSAQPLPAAAVASLATDQLALAEAAPPAPHLQHPDDPAVLRGGCRVGGGAADHSHVHRHPGPASPAAPPSRPSWLRPWGRAQVAQNCWGCMLLLSTGREARLLPR
jgi:hypothetical protein